MKGAGVWAGANTSGEGGGVDVVGDAVLLAIQNRKEEVSKLLPTMGPEQCSRNAQIGAAIHELLHTFGYRHEDGGIMQEWWKWPNIGYPSKQKFSIWMRIWG